MNLEGGTNMHKLYTVGRNPIVRMIIRKLCRGKMCNCNGFLTIYRNLNKLCSSYVIVDGGYKIKTDKIDSLFLRMNQVYEPEVRQAIRNILIPFGGISVDVGANIGYHTILLASNSSHVIAIEPEPQNLDILKYNISENNCNNVEIVPMAITSNPGKIKLHLNPKNTGGHSVIIQPTNRYIVVESIRLDQIIPAGPIRLLKLDIEGGEYDAIISLGDRLNDVENIIYEHWPNNNIQDPATLLDDFYIHHLGGANYLAIRMPHTC